MRDEAVAQTHAGFKNIANVFGDPWSVHAACCMALAMGQGVCRTHATTAEPHPYKIVCGQEPPWQLSERDLPGKNYSEGECNADREEYCRCEVVRMHRSPVDIFCGNASQPNRTVKEAVDGLQKPVQPGVEQSALNKNGYGPQHRKIQRQQHAKKPSQRNKQANVQVEWKRMQGNRVQCAAPLWHVYIKDSVHN